MSRRAESRRAGLGLALVFCAALPAARGAPDLYAGDGRWAAVAGLPESTPPPGADWNFQDGLWVGRIPEGAPELAWGAERLALAAARPPPPPVVALPPARNAFGECVVRSLSVRYHSVVRSRRWSLVFSDDAEFDPLEFTDGSASELRLELEDVVAGRRWTLRPERRGREGGRFPGRDDPRFHGGTEDDGDIDWSLVMFPREDGRRILQGQISLLRSETRLLRLRVLLRAGAPGAPVLQAESPPAIVAAGDGRAVGLFPDPAEPRRFRSVAGDSDWLGVEFDLAVTKATGNFPGRATFSLEVEAWPTAGPAAAPAEAIAKLARAGGGVALPEFVARDGLGAIPRFEIGALRLSHPGGFRDRADAWHHLLLRTSGLFADHDWAAGAFQCAAQDEQGEPRMELAGETAVLAVNPDPDLETLLELGPNRGLTVLARIRRRRPAAVWIRAGTRPVLDHGARALYLCDYPAVWHADSAQPGVDLRHAEAELISSLACVLKPAGVCLLVEDAGPLAFFTTFHADALVSAAVAPDEMRRQRALAGPRPVLWTAADPDPAAEQLARDLGFVRTAPIAEN